MASHQNQFYDLGQQSMLRMIRSARSRLSREHSVGLEDDKASSRNSIGGQVGSSQLAGDRQTKRSSTARSSFGGVGRNRLSRSRSSLDSAAGSENVAPEKSQEPVNRGGSALGEITNIAVVPMPHSEASNAVKPTLSGAGQQTTMMASQGQAAAAREPSLAQQPKPSSTAATFASTGAASADYVEADVKNAEDPQHVMEYMPDIFTLLQKEEALCRVSPGYMDRQVHVNAKMRGILVDWLVSVQQKYKLKAETLFMAISLLDRYLEQKATARRYLQLVGVTSMLIAAKWEEVYPPQINDFVYVTDKAYTKEDIVKMEVAILGALDFKICRPTPMQFLDRYQSVNGCSEAHFHLAQYLLELTLVDYNMLKYCPSRLAAASVLLSNKLLRKQPSWKAAAVKHTNFNEQMLKECAKEMCALLEYAEHSPLQAVRKKFSQTKYNSVAKLSFTGAPSSGSATDEASRLSIGTDRRRSLGGSDLSRPPTSSPGAPPPPASSALFDKTCLGGALDLAAI